MADNANVDGSVVISVEVDAKGFDKGAGDIEKALRSLEGTLKSSIEQMSKALSGTLTDAFKNLGNVTGSTGQVVENTMSKATESVDEFTSHTEQAMAELEQRIKEHPEDFYDYRTEMQSGGIGGPVVDVTDQSAMSVSNVQTEMNEITQATETSKLTLQDWLRTIKECFTVHFPSAISQMMQDLEGHTWDVINAFRNAGSALNNFLSNDAVNSVAKTVVDTLSKLAKGFINVGKQAIKTAVKLNIFNRAQKELISAMNKLTKGFTGIFRMLKGRFKRQLVTTIFTSITDSIKEMAKVDEGFNKSVSTMQSSLKQFAAAVVSAFAPLVKTVAPIISKLAQYITAVTDKAGQLIAALTGQSTYQKAQYNYTDYAKSLDDTTESTDDLTDSTKELNKQLAAFDELNVFSTSSNLDTDSKDIDSDLTTAPVYTEVPISFDMTNLSERIKEAFEMGDFTDLGVELGEKINEGISKIDSSGIGSTIARVINSASSFAVGFLSTVDWGEITSKITDNLNSLIEKVNVEQLGEAFAEIINTVFEIGLTFTEEFDWEKLGTKISDFINGVFENTDWKQVGKTINNVITGILDTALVLLDDLDGDLMGDSFGTMLGEIDIGTICVKLAKVLWGILQRTWEILKGLWEGSGVLGYWEEQGTWLGEALAEHFVVPFKESLRKLKADLRAGNWGQFFLDIFVNPIIDLINSMLGKIEWGLNSILSFGLNQIIQDMGLEEYVGFIEFIDLGRIDRIETAPKFVPHLATGTVVPANYGEFAAILGDNKRETEVVSPLSTMKQAMLEALAESGLMGGNNDGDIVINIDGREVFRAVRNQNDSYKRMHGGKSALG